MEQANDVGPEILRANHGAIGKPKGDGLQLHAE